MAVATSRSSVVLPEPFQPRSHTVSPRAISRLTLADRGQAVEQPGHPGQPDGVLAGRHRAAHAA